MQDRPGPFTLREGAAVLGISLNTLRRRIATGQVTAERVERPQGFVWQVYVDGAAPSHEGANETVQRDRPGTVLQPPTAIMQAEAMAAYTRSLLEPLVAHVAALEGTIREQAETIGSLRAELTALTAPQQPQAGSGAPDPPEPPSEPAPAPEPFPWPIPPHPNWRTLAPWLLMVLVIVGAVALEWPR